MNSDENKIDFENTENYSYVSGSNDSKVESENAEHHEENLDTAPKDTKISLGEPTNELRNEDYHEGKRNFAHKDTEIIFDDGSYELEDAEFQEEVLSATSEDFIGPRPYNPDIDNNEVAFSNDVYIINEKNEKSAPSYVTKRFFIISLLVAIVISSVFSTALSTYLENRSPSYKNLAYSSLENATKSKLSIKEIGNMNKDAVVEITTTSGGRSEGAGSGIIVKSNGYIATNYHVIDGATTVAVRLHNGKSFSADVIGYDAQTDIAVIKINAKDLHAVTIGRSSKLSVGDLAVVIGNPLGKLGGTVTSGIISAKDRQIQLEGRNRTLLQTDAAINEGNSGGALFNAKGQLVGIVVAKGSGSGIEGLGFAIPIDAVASSLDDIIEHGTVTGKPVAGITIYDAPLENAGSAQASAVTIAEVKGKNAKAAGLKKGDQIVSINNDKVNTSEELISAIQAHRIGDTVKLGIKRGDQDMSVNIKLQSSTEIK